MRCYDTCQFIGTWHNEKDTVMKRIEVFPFAVSVLAALAWGQSEAAA
jgi:hypothetical protein